MEELQAVSPVVRFEFGEIPATEIGNEIGLGDLEWRVEMACLGAGCI